MHIQRRNDSLEEYTLLGDEIRLDREGISQCSPPQRWNTASRGVLGIWLSTSMAQGITSREYHQITSLARPTFNPKNSGCFGRLAATGRMVPPGACVPCLCRPRLAVSKEKPTEAHTVPKNAATDTSSTGASVHGGWPSIQTAT